MSNWTNPRYDYRGAQVLLHDDFRNQATGVRRGSWGVRSSMEVGI